MESRPRTFTREEAEALLPAVDRLLGEAQALAAGLSSTTAEGQAAHWRPRTNGKVPTESTEATPDATRRSIANQVSALLERLRTMGIVVRDLRSGLIDFPSLRDERVIHLCWRRGEPLEIHWWHEVDAGFAGRQLL